MHDALLTQCRIKVDNLQDEVEQCLINLKKVKIFCICIMFKLNNHFKEERKQYYCMKLISHYKSLQIKFTNCLNCKLNCKLQILFESIKIHKILQINIISQNKNWMIDFKILLFFHSYLLEGMFFQPSV
jgi:hypothetical protein